jgi:hypothetical protein
MQTLKIVPPNSDWNLEALLQAGGSHPPLNPLSHKATIGEGGELNSAALLIQL